MSPERENATAARPPAAASASAPPPASPPPPLAASRRGRRLFRVARALLVVALLGAMAAWAAQWVRTAILYVHETDARVMADLVTVSSQADGRLVALEVREGDRARAGQTLARLDASAAEAALAETVAERETLRAERARAEAEARAVAGRVESRIDSARSKLVEAEAGEGARAHERDFAESEFRRIESLAGGGVAPAARLERARADALTARQEWRRARAAVASARAALAEAEAARDEIAVARAEGAELDARIAEAEARIARRRIDIAERGIASPIDGVIGRVFVDPGEYLARGQRVLSLHDPERVWIETNIRETEIGRLAVGQPVRVEVDAWPGVAFEGRVERIGAAATSQFALLPRLNEAGAFTKVTQRIRVRIALERRGERLRPGTMAVVYIDDGTADRLAPWLALR